jgi:2-polyprenyl-3-methyl-5-hydroxy-6-metoxy-1,4-benzoquinol methylase
LDDRLTKLFARSRAAAKTVTDEAVRSRYFPELWYLTENWLSIAKSRQVLEVGCGLGLLSEALVRSGWRLTTTDPSPAALAGTKARLGDAAAAVFTRVAGEDLQVPSGSFDAVVCANLLEFSAKPLKVLAQIERALAPEGRAVIATFNKMSPWGLASVARGMRPEEDGGRPLRCLTRPEFLGLLRASGLKVHELKTRACYLPAPAKGIWALKLRVAGAYVALVTKRRKKKTPPPR